MENKTNSPHIDIDDVKRIKIIEDGYVEDIDNPLIQAKRPWYLDYPRISIDSRFGLVFLNGITRENESTIKIPEFYT